MATEKTVSMIDYEYFCSKPTWRGNFKWTWSITTYELEAQDRAGWNAPNGKVEELFVIKIIHEIITISAVYIYIYQHCMCKVNLVFEYLFEVIVTCLTSFVGGLNAIWTTEWRKKYMGIN